MEKTGRRSNRTRDLGIAGLVFHLVFARKDNEINLHGVRIIRIGRHRGGDMHPAKSRIKQIDIVQRVARHRFGQRGVGDLTIFHRQFQLVAIFRVTAETEPEVARKCGFDIRLVQQRIFTDSFIKGVAFVQLVPQFQCETITGHIIFRIVGGGRRIAGARFRQIKDAIEQRAGGIIRIGDFRLAEFIGADPFVTVQNAIIVSVADGGLDCGRQIAHGDAGIINDAVAVVIQTVGEVNFRAAEAAGEFGAGDFIVAVAELRGIQFAGLVKSLHDPQSLAKIVIDDVVAALEQRNILQGVIAFDTNESEDVLAVQIRVTVIDKTIVVGIDGGFLRAEDFRLGHADSQIRHPNRMSFLNELRLGGILVKSRRTNAVVRRHDTILEHGRQSLQFRGLFRIKCRSRLEIRQIGVVFNGLATVVEAIVADETVLVAFGVVADFAVAAVVVGRDFAGGERLVPEAEFINITFGAAFADDGDGRRIQIQGGNAGSRGNSGAIDIQCRRVGVVVAAQPRQGDVVPDAFRRRIGLHGIYRGVIRQR